MALKRKITTKRIRVSRNFLVYIDYLRYDLDYPQEVSAQSNRAQGSIASQGHSPRRLGAQVFSHDLLMLRMHFDLEGS